MMHISAMARQVTRTGAALLAAAAVVASGCGNDSNDFSLQPLEPPDAEFQVVSPVGPIAYEGRDYFPTCMDGSPYHFFVKRGSVNKLLMYYQGGGACWDQLTCSVPACDTTVDPNGGDNPNGRSTGFGDLTNPDNPFRDWSIVVVSYCSCDIHFGDAAQDYPLHVEHRGYHNAKVAEKYAREHFRNPEEVFVTGSSAGAYGAFFNAPLLERVWPRARFSVLADAGNGVVTQSFLDTYFPNWNFAANLPDDIPGLREVLENGSGIPGYTAVVAAEFPDTNWAHYSTAYDGGTGGQTGFYNIMINDNDPIAALSWWEGSCAFNAQMRSQAQATAAAIPDNYRYYIGTGSRHTMWGSDKVYGDTTGGVPPIVDWINAMRDRTPTWTNVECTNCGLTLPGDPAPDPLRPPFAAVGDEVVITCP
jgi:Pectinacetylesterase